MRGNKAKCLFRSLKQKREAKVINPVGRKEILAGFRSQI